MGAIADALPPQDGQDLLRVLATEAITQETAVTDTSATSRTEMPRVRKTGQSRMPNQTIQFPRKQQRKRAQNELPVDHLGQSRENRAEE
jgi:hypothetical protein